MEKTTELKPTAPEREAFFINDSATGKSTAIRECSDAMLERAAETMKQQHTALQSQALQLLTQCQQAACGEALMRYELDRRRRSITLASVTDLRKLS